MAVIDPATLTGKQLWLKQSGLPGGVGTRGLWTDSTGATASLQAGTNPVVDNGPDPSRLSVRFDTGFYAFARDMTGYANQEIWLLLKGVSANAAPFDFGKDAGLASHYPYSDGNCYDDAYTVGRTNFAWAGSLAEMTTWSVLRLKLTGAALEYWVNNALRLTRGSGCSSSNIWNPLRIGGNNVTVSNGWIAEAIAFDHNLTTTEAQGVYEYLASPLNPFTNAFAGAGTYAITRPLSFLQDLTGLTTEASEPGSLTTTGWMKVTVPYASVYRFNAAPTSGVVGINVYTGSAIGALTLVASGTSAAPLKAQLSPGTTYYVQLGQVSGTSGSFVFDMRNGLNYTTEVLADTPMLFWPLDDAAGSLVAADWSGNGRDGAVTTAWTFGKTPKLLGSASASEADVNGFIQSAAITWPTSGFITYEYWLNVGPTSGFMAGAWVNVNYLDIIYNNPAGTFGLNNGAVSHHGCNQPAAGIHHIVHVIPMAASTTTSKVYIDGVSQTIATGTAFTTVALASSAFRLSDWQLSGWRMPTGLHVDNVAIYSGELSAARVAAHYAAGTNPLADAFADAGAAVVPTVVTSYDTSAWTTEASEPLTLPKDKTGWASFTPRYNGTYRLSTVGSSYDTGIAVYTGSAIGALTLVASDDSSGGVDYSSAVLADAPVGWWRLDETSGTTMTDSSGNGRHGTYSGSPTLGVSGGPPITGGGTVATFDGVNDCGTVPYGTWLGVSFTVEAWVKTTNTGSKIIVSRDNDNGEPWMFGAIGPSGDQPYLPIMAQPGNPTTYPPLTSTTLEDGSWHHVVGTYDNPTRAIKVYFDGTLLASATGVAAIDNTGTAALSIGRRGTGSPVWFTGSICEVAFYGTALSAARIAAHYAAAATGAAASLTIPMTAGTTYRIQVGAGAAAVTLTGLLNFSLAIASYDSLLLKGRSTKVLDAQPGG